MRARVYIATTEGPVLVQRLAPEEGLAEAELSAVCLDGTPTRLPITGAYTWFVRDHVRSFSGGAAYRLDLDARIDGGSSWMLGAWVAHLLLSEGRLAVGDDSADAAVFATGEVAVATDAERRTEVRSVGHVTDKVARLAQRAAEEAAAGRRVVLLVPRENAVEAGAAVERLPATVRERLTLRVASDTAEVREVLTPPDGAAPATPAAAASATASSATEPPTATSPARVDDRRRGGKLAVALLACVLLGTGAAGFWSWRNVEREWEDLRLAGRYVELARSLDGFPLRAAADHVRTRWLDPGAAAGFTLQVAARRPADGGSCSGMRFRGSVLATTPVNASGPLYRLTQPRSLCGLEIQTSPPETGTAGYAWISLRMVPEGPVPVALLPAHRVVSSTLADSPVALSLDLPLYVQDHWAWAVTSVWAPAPSEDVAPLLETGDDAALDALTKLGLRVTRARVEWAR